MMLNWSLGFLCKVLNNRDMLYAGLAVSSLNMLIQVALDFLCGSKRFSKLGGWCHD